MVVAYPKLVKMLGNKHFCVEMFELENGHYFIRTESGNEAELSESIEDFNTASFLFDLRVQELEGH